MMKRTLIIIFCTTAVVLGTSVGAEGNRPITETSSEATSNNKQEDGTKTHESVEIVIPTPRKRDKDRSADIEIRIDAEEYLRQSENPNLELKPGRPGVPRSPGRPAKPGEQSRSNTYKQ